MTLKRPCVFVDRDGTLIRNVDLLCTVDQVRVLKSAVTGVKKLNAMGLRVIVITNQPVVARNLCTEKDVQTVNAFIQAEFKRQGALIDSFYYCPHHPEKNHPEANDQNYRRDCDCRKPKPGMLLQAAQEHGVDLEKSFMIGDSTVDVQTGKNAGCRTILLKTGVAGTDRKYLATPDFVCTNLQTAADVILNEVAPCKAIICAGGLAQRLRPLTETIPKCLVDVKGKPLIEWQIEQFKKYGITDIVVLTGFLHEKIESALGDGRALGVRIRYSRETEPLGTGGALKHARQLIAGPFIMVYGDVLFSVNLQRLLDFHREKGGIATLTLHPSEHPFDSDMVDLGADARVRKILGKPLPGTQFTNLSNAGLYVMEKAFLDLIPDGKSGLDREVIPHALETGSKVYGYVTDELLHDIGTIERLQKATDTHKGGGLRP